MLKLSCSFLFLFFFLSLSSCTQILETFPTSYIEDKLKKDLSNIENLKYFQTLKIPDFTYKTEKGADITISLFQPFLNILNPDMFSYSLAIETYTFSLTYNKPETSKISAYMMAYQSIITSTEYAGQKCSVYFSILANNYKFDKIVLYDKEIKLYKNIGKVEIEFILGDYETTSGCPISNDEIKSALDSFIKTSSEGFVKGFNEKAVNVYYLSIPLPLYLNLFTSTATPVSIAHTLDLSISDYPSIQDNSILFKYSGKVNGKSNENLAFNFDKNVDSHKIALKKVIFQNLIKEGLFSFKIEESNKPITDYSLTVESLSAFCSQLKTLYDPNLVVTIQNEMQNVDYPEDSPLGIRGVVTIKSDIISTEDKSIILSFNWEVSFLLKPTLFQFGLNFYLDKYSLQVNKIAVNPEPARTMDNEDKLENWITLSYSVALAKKEYNLLARSMDMRYFFKTNRNISASILGEYIILSEN